ncbi:ImmA/IrrE family metallo-endopeptidase [bacterium]|nr:ImmA/IrrE family metallo-endopeptidase [bacterium]MBU1064360.1 ImmA/IrrE family metallo-endopeptidase [bacterium]MBU1634112.1 ImmA/IrrE family metallo-endopeptidase [bacterium]MBU1873604.1 ImmA/IrrE family metallo-endopeptidase [bacterium]
MLEIHHVLRDLREKNGLTQSELAEAMEISRDTVARVETAAQKLTVDYLMTFAGIVNMHPVDIFRRMESNEPAFVYLLRAHGSDQFSDSIRDKYEDWYNRMEALIEETHLSRLKEIPSKDYEIFESDNPAEQGTRTAQWLRKKWKMGNEPIADPVQLIESLGYYITGMDLGENDIFAITGRKGENGRPGIIVNTNPAITVERQHYSIIHELAHIVEHGEYFEEQPDYSGIGPNKDDREKFADAFAAEFLVPLEEVLARYRQLPANLDIERKVIILKSYFKVSYQVIMIRLIHSDVLNMDERSCWKYYGYLKRKYGRHEPMPIRHRPEFMQEQELKELSEMSTDDFMEEHIFPRKEGLRITLA